MSQLLAAITDFAPFQFLCVALALLGIIWSDLLAVNYSFAELRDGRPVLAALWFMLIPAITLFLALVVLLWKI